MDKFAAATAVAAARHKFKEGGKQLHEKKATQIVLLTVPFRQAGASGGGSGKALKTRKVKIQPRMGKVATDCSVWLGLANLQRSFDGLLKKQVDLREQAKAEEAAILKQLEVDAVGLPIVEYEAMLQAAQERIADITQEKDEEAKSLLVPFEFMDWLKHHYLGDVDSARRVNTLRLVFTLDSVDVEKMYSVRVGIQKPIRKDKKKKAKGKSKVAAPSEQYNWICSTAVVAGQEKIMLVVEGRINFTRDAYAQMLVEVWVSDDVSGNPMLYGCEGVEGTTVKSVTGEHFSSPSTKAAKMLVGDGDHILNDTTSVAPLAATAKSVRLGLHRTTLHDILTRAIPTAKELGLTYKGPDEMAKATKNNNRSDRSRTDQYHDLLLEHCADGKPGGGDLGEMGGSPGGGEDLHRRATSTAEAEQDDSPETISATSTLIKQRAELKVAREVLLKATDPGPNSYQSYVPYKQQKLNLTERRQTGYLTLDQVALNTSSDVWPPTHHHSKHNRNAVSKAATSIATAKSPLTSAAVPAERQHSRGDHENHHRDHHHQKADPISGTLPFFEQWVAYATHWLWASMRHAAKAAHRDLDDDKDSGWCALRQGDFDSGRVFLWHDPSSYAIWEDKAALKLAQQQWHAMATCAKRTRRAAEALERQRVADQRRMRVAAGVAVGAATAAALLSIHAREAAYKALQERIEKEAALARAFRANKRAAAVAYEANISAVSQVWHAITALLLLVCDKAATSASAHAARASAITAKTAAEQAVVVAVSRSNIAGRAVAYVVARDRAERRACEAAIEAAEEVAGRFRRALDIVHKLERVLIAEAVCVKVARQAASVSLVLSRRIELLVAATAMRVRALQAASAAMSAAALVITAAAVARAHVVAAAVIRSMFGHSYEQGSLGATTGSSCGFDCHGFDSAVRYGVGGGCSGLLQKPDTIRGLPQNHLTFRINSSAVYWVAEAAVHDVHRVVASQKRAMRRAVAIAAACSTLAAIAARRSAVDAAEATLVGARQVVRNEHSAYLRLVARQKAEATQDKKCSKGTGAASAKHAAGGQFGTSKADGRVIAALAEVEQLQKRQKEHLEVVLHENLKRALDRDSQMATMLHSVAREEHHAVRAGDGTYLRDVLEQNHKSGMRSPRRWVRRVESLQQLHAAAREADARRVRQLAEEHRFVLLHRLRPHRRFLALQELAHRWSAEDVWVLGKGSNGKGSGLTTTASNMGLSSSRSFGEDQMEGRMAVGLHGVDASLVSTLGLSAAVRTSTGTARRLPAQRSSSSGSVPALELHQIHGQGDGVGGGDGDGGGDGAAMQERAGSSSVSKWPPRQLALASTAAELPPHERLPHWGVSTILSQNWFLQALGEQRDPLEYQPVPRPRAPESMSMSMPMPTPMSILSAQNDHADNTSDRPGRPPFVNKQSVTAGEQQTEFVCDGCDMDLVEGVRYRSSVVADFDLCSICFATSKYDESHGPFVSLSIENGSDASICEDSPMYGLKGDQLYWSQDSGRLLAQSSNHWESLDVGRTTGLIFAEKGGNARSS